MHRPHRTITTRDRLAIGIESETTTSTTAHCRSGGTTTTTTTTSGDHGTRTRPSSAATGSAVRVMMTETMHLPTTTIGRTGTIDQSRVIGTYREDSRPSAPPEDSMVRLTGTSHPLTATRVSGRTLVPNQQDDRHSITTTPCTTRGHETIGTPPTTWTMSANRMAEVHQNNGHRPHTAIITRMSTETAVMREKIMKEDANAELTTPDISKSSRRNQTNNHTSCLKYHVICKIREGVTPVGPVSSPSCHPDRVLCNLHH